MDEKVTGGVDWSTLTNIVVGQNAAYELKRTEFRVKSVEQRWKNL